MANPLRATVARKVTKTRKSACPSQRYKKGGCGFLLMGIELWPGVLFLSPGQKRTTQTLL